MEFKGDYENITPPKYIGGYYLGGKMGIGIMFIKKPNIIHRYFMKILLGWEWIDNTKL